MSAEPRVKVLERICEGGAGAGAEDELPGVSGLTSLVENGGGLADEEFGAEGIEIRFGCADFFHDGFFGFGSDSELRYEIIGWEMLFFTGV